MKNLKVLVVDNATHYKKRLTNLLNGHDVTFLSYDDDALKEVKAHHYNLIILSGGQRHSVKTNAKKYADEINLIQNSKVPIIGICLGAQLIAYAYGANLRYFFKVKRKGIEKIFPVQHSEVMANMLEARVFESNHWMITDLPDELKCLAASKEGVEVFEHHQKPQFGLQFHPERGAEGNDGKIIFDNILKQLDATVWSGRHSQKHKSSQK